MTNQLVHRAWKVYKNIHKVRQSLVDKKKKKNKKHQLHLNRTTWREKKKQHYNNKK